GTVPQVVGAGADVVGGRAIGAAGLPRGRVVEPERLVGQPLVRRHGPRQRQRCAVALVVVVAVPDELRLVHVELFGKVDRVAVLNALAALDGSYGSHGPAVVAARSEERRVGKEGSSQA